MDKLRDEMLLGYLSYVYDTESDQETRDEKVAKAVADYMLDKQWRAEGTIKGE